jgi:hypothetical protein
MRGRRPKPTRLKVLTGNPGKRPLNMDEPQPEPAIPDCPPRNTTLYAINGHHVPVLPGSES